MKSIIVILPYFGSLPNMFPFWLESCKMNENIDFLIATDQDLKVNAPNIHVINFTLKQVKARIEKFFGFEVWLEKPYKLCDLKPFYNEIFHEYVTNYDFWGYCDCDLIFGDIRRFITDEILNSKDCILGMGHFHLQRVKDVKYENVWKTARGLWHNIQWKEVFKSQNNEWFDELPYGVSGRYYEMYPKRFWSGFEQEGRCYEGPSSLYLPFVDVYNCYNLYLKDPAYQNHVERLPFWKRKKSEELRNVVYVKDGIDLYAVGTNAKGDIVKHPIMYAHFYKRKFSLKTTNLQSYMIYPNVFSERKPLNKFLIKWYANNPCLSLYLKWSKFMSKIRRILNGK